MLNVNTISFNGCKAVINSYTDHASLIPSMERQQVEWAARFPNAVVVTERLDTLTVHALVAEGRAKGESYAWKVGEMSKGGE